MTGACVETNVDYPQGFLSQLDGISSISECKSLCEKKKECVRFIVLATLNRCILKNNEHEERTTEGWITKQNSYSASMDCLRKIKQDKKDNKAENNSERNDSVAAFAIDIEGACIETNVDYPKGFIAQFDDVESLSECEKLCKKQKECVRFVALASLNRCILKNNEHEQQTTEGWITTQNSYSASMNCLKETKNDEDSSEKENNVGVKEFAVDVDSSCIENNVDYPQGFISQFNDIKSISDCNKLCKKQDGCVRFVILASLNRCILKNSRHEERTTEGWITTQNSYTASMECLKTVRDKGKEETGDFVNDLIDDSCTQKEKAVFGKALKKFDGIKKTSDCKKKCIETDGCSVFLILVVKQKCQLYDSSAKMMEKRVRESIVGELSCEVDDNEKNKQCIVKNADFPKGYLSGIKNVKSVFFCKAECRKTNKCAAFTYIPKTEQCTLRSAAHEPMSKKTWAAKNGAISGKLDCSTKDETVNEDKCFERNVDYREGTIKELSEVYSVRQCFNLCLYHDQCFRATYSLVSKNCIFKSEKHGTKTSKKSSISFAVKSLQCKEVRDRYDHTEFLDIDPDDMEKDRHYPGGEIAKVDKVKNLSSCVKLCKQNDNCVRVLALLQKRSCILKNDEHEAGVFKKGVVSVALKWKEAEESGGCWGRNVDFPGGEIKRKMNVPGPLRCVSICKFTKKCVRIVFVPNENLCILKDETHGPATRQSAIANRNAVSISLKCREAKRSRKNEKEKSGEGKKFEEKNDEKKKSDDENEKIKTKEETGREFIDLDEQEVLYSTAYRGGFIRKIDGTAKLSKCKKACADDKYCFVVVANVMSKRCFLLSKEHGMPEKRKSFVSVMVRERKPKKTIIKFIDVDPATLQMDVAYTGGTLVTMSDVDGLSECVQACLQSLDCILVVANVQMKQCFLRDAGHGRPRKKSGFVSVVVRQKKAEKELIDRKKNGLVNNFIDISRDEIEMDTVYSGGLLSSINKASSLSQCKQTCLKTEGCVRVVANINTRKCFFRNNKSGTPKKSKSFVSLLVKSEQGDDTEDVETTTKKKAKQYKDKQNCKFMDVENAELNTRYLGGLIVTLTDQKALSDCVKQCSEQPDCVRVDAFVTLKRCALKNKNHDTRPSSQQGMVSVVVRPTKKSDNDESDSHMSDKSNKIDEFIDVQRSILEIDTGYRAGLIADKPAKTFSQCIKICQETEGCVRVDGLPRIQQCKLRNNQYGEAISHRSWISYRIKKTQSDKNAKKIENEFVDLEDEQMQRDIAYSSGWISTIPKVQSMSECLNLCRQNDQCVVFTVVPKFKRCSLINKNHGKGQRKLGFISLSIAGGEIPPDAHKEKKPKINYCTEVVASLDPKDRRSFVKQAKCSRSNELLRSINDQSVQCCQVKSCPILQCRTFMYGDQKRCPPGMAIHSVGFNDKGLLKKMECCKRKCEWKMCKDRSNSCNKEEVMTKVTETNCQVKPCPRVVRCCSIVPTEETEIKIDDKRTRKPEVKDRTVIEPKERRKGNKGLANPLLQPGWYYNSGEKIEDEDLEDQDLEEDLEDQDLEDKDFEEDSNSFNSNPALSSSGLEDSMEVASDCINVRFENSGDMLFASCKGDYNVITRIGAEGLGCCRGPILRSCVLVLGQDGCPLNTLAHSIEIKNGNPTILECCHPAEAVLTSCTTNSGECDIGQVVVDVLFPDCFGEISREECLPDISCCYYDKSLSSYSPEDSAPICTFNSLEWRDDILAKFGRCFGADHVLKSVEDKVKCCEGDCNTVDCTVIDQYDGDTLTCPWGSVANGLGVSSDGVTYLECCITNCRYGKCVERRGACVDGEVVQDITANGDTLVLKCCAVLDLLSEEEFDQRRYLVTGRKKRSAEPTQEPDPSPMQPLPEPPTVDPNEYHRRSRRDVSGAVSGRRARREAPTADPADCRLEHFSEKTELSVHYAGCERKSSVMRKASPQNIDCCASNCQTSRCNIVEVESRDTFSCPPGTIINAIGKSAVTDKITLLSCCDLDCRIGECAAREAYCKPGEVISSIRRDIQCNRLPCPFKVECCETVDKHSLYTEKDTIFAPTFLGMGSVLGSEQPTIAEVHEDHAESAAYNKFLIPTENCPYIIRGRSVTCPVTFELDVVHMIDADVLEARCCVSEDNIPCTPTLDKACEDAICSVGLAGSGLFKLGCLSVNKTSEPKKCLEFVMRGTDVISCPSEFSMSDIFSSCPDGIHENCAIHVTCCTDELPVYFEIKRHVPASVLEVQLFDSVVIDCEMYKTALVSKLSLGRIPEGTCGPAAAERCYFHHSFATTESVTCDEGYAFKSISFTPDGLIASPYSCCSIGGYDSLETKVIEAMNSVDCEHGFVHAVKVDTTKSDSRISVTCVYTKDALGSFEDGVLESSVREMGETKQKLKKACILQNSMILGKNINSMSTSTFWSCMAACWKSETCKVGSYVPKSKLCYLKAEFDPVAKKTAWSETNKVKSFDFTCSISVDERSQVAPAPVEKSKKKSKSSWEKEKSKSAIKQKKACILEDSIIAGKNINSMSTATFWSCMDACRKSKSCKVGSYVSTTERCYLKAEFEPVAKKTAWSETNKVKSFDFTCSISVDERSQVAPAPVEKSKKKSKSFWEKKKSKSAIKQKKACILEDSMIAGKNINSMSTATFWSCMAECGKSETCKVGSYVPTTERCYLKAEFEPVAKKTTWSETNKVKSFDFTCSISVDKRSQVNPAPVERKSRSSWKKKSSLANDWRPWNIVKTLKSIKNPVMIKHVANNKEPLCVYKAAIYPDGTINSKTEDTAEGCANLCADTEDCVIATYVGSNNKCILKGKQHKPLTRSDWASDNQVITYDFENKCVGVRSKSARRSAKEAELENDARDGKAPCRYHNVVFAGGTFFSADSQSVKQCTDLCLKKPQCSAVTFLQEQERCHLKSKKHTGPLFNKFAIESGAISLDYRCDRKAYHSFLKQIPEERKIHGLTQACRYKNKRIAGQVVERIDLVTEHECGTACLSSHDCFGITYQLSSMTCYLKSESHNGPMSKETLGVVSYDFTLDCTPEGKNGQEAPPVVKLVEHLDMVYRGPILRSTHSIETSEDCIEICSKSDKCKAVTYISGPTSIKCFLRGKNHGPLFPLKSTETRKVVSYELDCDKNNKPNRPMSEQPCLLSAKVFTGGYLETRSDINSPEECFNACSSVKLCVAATYAPVTKKCFLRDSSREGPKMTEYAVKNKVVSYDFLCAQNSADVEFKSDDEIAKNDNAPPNVMQKRSKQSCSLEGQVFTGGFLESKIGVVSSKDCFQYCSTLQGCVTATYAPNVQKCFLRDSSRKGPTTTVFATTNKLLSHDFLCDAKTNQEATKLPKDDIGKTSEDTTKASDIAKNEANSKRSCWLKGQIFTGGFLETKTDVGSSKNCFDFCSSVEDCVAATYAPNTKKCFLRDSSREDPSKTDFAAKNNLVSYDFLCKKTDHDKPESASNENTKSVEQLPKQPCFLKGQVFTGGFLETKTGLSNPKQCFEYCSSLKDCVAATYVPNAQKCFLRDSSREDPTETVYATTNKVVSYDFLCDGEKEVSNNNKPKIVDRKFPDDKKSCILKAQVFQNGLIEVIDSFETATLCSEECFTVEKCVVASYCFKTKKCYLRDSNRVGPLEKPGFISYDKACLKNIGDDKNIKANPEKPRREQSKNLPSMNNDEPCVLQGKFFTGGFLETVQSVNDALSCSEECSMDDDCAAASYNFNKKTCRLMDDSREGPKKISGVVSFDFLCKKGPNNPKQEMEKSKETHNFEKPLVRPTNQDSQKSAKNDQPCVLMGQLYNGGFLETIASVEVPLFCSEECAMNEDCASATYNAKLKTCRLMDKTRDGPKKMPGVVSFNFLCSKKSKTPDKINNENSGDQFKNNAKPDDEQPCVLQGQFFSGGYLETVNSVSNPLDCSEECSMDENCATASYNFKMKTCRLMDKTRRGPQKMAGVVSFDFSCLEESSFTKSPKEHEKLFKADQSEKTQYAENVSDRIVEYVADNEPCVLQGQSFTGGFLETIKSVENPLSCSEECSMDENCAAASYSWKFKSCRLMDRNRIGPKKMPGVISFDFLCKERPKDPKKSEAQKVEPSPKQQQQAKKSCLLNGQVFNGGFLKTLIGVSSAKTCFEKCSVDKECVTATYVPKTKSCSLRNPSRTGPKNTEYATANNVVSYDFLCETDKTDIKEDKKEIDSKVSNESSQKDESCVLQGQSFTGGFLEVVPSVGSPLSCSDECLMDENCVTATYNIKMKSCRLMNKNRKGPNKMPGAVSFDYLCQTKDKTNAKISDKENIIDKPEDVQKHAKNDNPCALQAQYFTGGFLETVNSVDNPLSCSDECLMDENCVSATYNTKMKTCRLMDKNRSGPKKQSGVVSFDFLCKRKAAPKPAPNINDTNDIKKTSTESMSKQPCTLKGQVFTGGFLESKTDVVSSKQCLEKCSLNKDCVAATYAPHSNSCYLRDSSRDDPKETAFAAKNEVVSFDYLCAKTDSDQKEMPNDKANARSKGESLPRTDGKISQSCLLTGHVFTGGFMEKKADITSMTKCFELCSNLEGCVALTYSPNNKGCFLRDSSREGPTKTEFAAKNGVVSYDLTCGQKVKPTPQELHADKPATKESANCLMANKVFSGGFLERKNDVASSEKCFQLCSKNMDCITATYAPNTKSCFLRDSTREGPQETEFASKNNMISYDFSCETKMSEKGSINDIKKIEDKITSKIENKNIFAGERRSCIHPGQTFTGGFLETKKGVTSPEKCVDICSSTNECATATYAPDSNSCFLRDNTRKGPQVTDFATKNKLVSYDFLCSLGYDQNGEKLKKNDGKTVQDSNDIADRKDVPNNQMQQCALQGQVFTGGFIEKKTDVLSSESCFDMCSENTDCVTATFAPNTKSCFLRDSSREGPEVTEFASNNDMISYDFLCEEEVTKIDGSTEKESISDGGTSEQPCMLQGQIFNGGFLETIQNIESPMHCSEECMMDKDCVTATYNFKIKTCRLMNDEREGPKIISGVVSFDFLCKNRNQQTDDSKKDYNKVLPEKFEDKSGSKAEPCVLQGQIFSGGFLETITSVEEPVSCSEECSMDENCFAAAYNAKMKTCRLMDKTREGPTKMPGALSFDFLCEKNSPESGPNEKFINDRSSKGAVSKQSCLLNGKVFTGGFIEKLVDISTSKICFEKCKLSEECVAVTFAPNTKSCFLRDSTREGPIETVYATTNKLVSYDSKCEEDNSSGDERSDNSQNKEKGESIQNSDVRASAKIPENKQACILQGRTFTGGFLETVTSVESLISCSDECLMDQDCVTASYNIKMKSCRLMNKDREGPKTQSGMVSLDFTCKTSDESYQESDKKMDQQTAPETGENDPTVNDKPCFLQSQSYAGGFLETVAPVDSPLSCSDECLMDENCVSSTYNIKMKTCRLMDKNRSGPKKQSGVVSFDFLCKKESMSKEQKNLIESPNQVKTSQQSTARQPCILKGQVFTGGFLETKNNVATSEKCSELCSSNKECGAASYTPNTKSCFLRDFSRVGPTETVFAAKNKIVSFDFACVKNALDLKDSTKTATATKDKFQSSSSNSITRNSINQACSLTGQVFTGGYLETKTNILTAEQCFKSCSSNKECLTATFSPNAKSCFLRDSSRKGPQVTEFATKNKMVSYDFLCEKNASGQAASDIKETTDKQTSAKSPANASSSGRVKSCTLHGQIFSGGFIETKTEVSSSEECFKMCSQNEDCATATFAPNAKSCFLRDSTREGPQLTEFATKNNMVSYDFLCEKKATKTTASDTKEASGEKESDKTSDKGSSLSGTVKSCTLHGEIFSGGFIETKTEVSSSEECFKMCSQNKDCATATYAPNAKSCFLRDSTREGPQLTEFATKNNMVSYDFICEKETSKEGEPFEDKSEGDKANDKTPEKSFVSPGKEQSCTLHGQIFTGGFLETKNDVSSLEKCFEICVQDKDCVAATYAPNTKSCFLRDSSREGPLLTEFAATNKMISYDFLCEKEAAKKVISLNDNESDGNMTEKLHGLEKAKNLPPCVVQGHAYTEGFLETVQNVESPLSCSEDCLMHDDCVAASYNFKMKTCRLMNDEKSGPVKTPGVVSFDFLCKAKHKTDVADANFENRMGVKEVKENAAKLDEVNTKDQPCVLYGQNFNGGFLETVNSVDSPLSCSEECLMDDDCVAASFDVKKKTCRLMDKTKLAPEKMSGVVSFDFLCKSGSDAPKNKEEEANKTQNSQDQLYKNPCILKGQVFTGGFLATENDVVSSEICFKKCQVNNECAAATYAPNTKSCFLRDSSREGPTETVFATTNGMVSYDFLCDGRDSQQNETLKDKTLTKMEMVPVELNGSRSEEDEPPISPPFSNNSSDEPMNIQSDSPQKITDDRKNQCLLIGQVFTGGFLKKLGEIPTSEECFEICSLDEECFAVTYQPRTKSCFLRDSSRDKPLKTDFAVANKLVSYDFICEGKFVKEASAQSRVTDNRSSKEDSPCILYEQLFQDGLLEVIDAVQSPLACSEDCSMDESCTAASYSSETKKCYLRDNRRTGPIGRVHFTSFDFSCKKNSSKTIESNTILGDKKEGCVLQGFMFTGGLIELLSKVRSAEECFEECSMMEDCVAATFSPKSRNCLLRNAERRGPIATYFSKLSEVVSIDFLCAHKEKTPEIKNGTDPCIFKDAYFIGGLIDSMDSVKSADGCFEECSMDDACSVATYNPVTEDCFLRDNLRRGPILSAFAEENKLISYDFACRHSNLTINETKKVESPETYKIPSNSTMKGKFPCRMPGQAFTGRTLEILENVLKGSDCSEECAMDAQCVSATYFPTTLKCYLRDNSRNGPVQTARSIADKIISYDFSCDPNMVRTTFTNSTGTRTQQSDDGREYCVFKRKSLSGTTLSVKESLPSPNDCMMSCSSEIHCVAATYNPMNRKCILRSDKGKAASTAYAIYNNIVSFDFQCKENTEDMVHQTPGNEPCRLPGMLFSGEILRKIVNITEETDCVKFCLDTEDCAVGTFNPALKTCILRDRNRNQATKSNNSVAHSVVSFDLLCAADDAATNEAVMKSKNPCRYVGNVFPGPALKIYSDLENEIGCLEKCETTGDCVAVTYNPMSERCVLKDEYRGDPVATENAVLDMIVSYDFLCNAASASDVSSTSETSTEPDNSENSGRLNNLEINDELDTTESSESKEPGTFEIPSESYALINGTDDLIDGVSDRENSSEEASDSINIKTENPCRLPNKFFNGVALSTIQNINDEQTCLRKCLEESACFVATYNPAQKKCLLKDENARFSSTSDDAAAAKIVSFDFLCNEDKFNGDGSSPDFENPKSDAESSKLNEDEPSFDVKEKCRLPGQYFPGVAMEIIRDIYDQYGCFSKCFKSTHCIAVTFDPRANKCILKDEFGDPPLEHTLDKSVVSYDFICSGDKTEEGQEDKDGHSHSANQGASSTSKFAKCRLFGAFFPGPEGALKILPNLKDESACFLECADSDECVAVTFNPTTSKCVLKDKNRKEPVTNARAVTEKVVSFDFLCNGKTDNARPIKSESGTPISKTKLKTPCIQKNQLYSGRYLSALSQIESGDECMKKCQTTDTCLVATYISSTERCYLRDENHGEMETSMWAVDNGAVSWDFACTSEPSEMPPDEVQSLPVGSVCRFDNAFFPGGTIKVIDNIDSPKECADQCRDDDKCEAFTYVVKEASCTLKCDLRKDPISTPWAVQNGAFSFLMQYCNEDDFMTESYDSDAFSRSTREANCFSTNVRFKVGRSYDLHCAPMHALKSIQMFEVSYNIECCRVAGEVRSFEHFCNDHAHTCPGNNLVNRNLLYKERCVSTCLETKSPPEFCWDTHVKNGYVDCGAGFVNSIEDLPVSVECCQPQQEEVAEGLDGHEIVELTNDDVWYF
ncbi:hypothetical protein ACHWQZ_G016969 [Mnemiopsis leidyi]